MIISRSIRCFISWSWIWLYTTSEKLNLVIINILVDKLRYNGN